MVAIFGAGTVVLGLTHDYATAFIALVVLSGADSVSVFIRATIVPLATPDHMRGRVSAVENVFIGASNEVGAFESGVASTLIGVGPAVVLGGALTMAVVGIWAFAFPDLRDINSFDDIAGPTGVDHVGCRHRRVAAARARTPIAASRVGVAARRSRKGLGVVVV